MRIAIIADIHGNALALDAALADIERGGYDHLVCLGDVIQGGPQPEQVVARLRSLGCPTVLGNADAYLLTGAETEAEPLADARRRRQRAPGRLTVPRGEAPHETPSVGARRRRAEADRERAS